MQRKIGAIKTKIESFKNSNKSVENEVLELLKLEKEIKTRRDNTEKRRAFLLKPINIKIQEKLKIFAKQNGYKKNFNVVDYEDSILYIDDSIFVTTEFIKFCNEEFEKEKTQNK